MTHYLLRLTMPLGEIVSEAHKDLPRAEYGWSRQLRSNRALYVVLKVCGLEDEKCFRYQAWLTEKARHEDEREAAALKEASR